MRSCGACVHRLNPILSFAGAPVAEKPTGLWCLQRVSTCQVTMTQAQHYLLAVSTSCLVAGCLNFVFLCAQNQFLWSALLVLLWTRKSVCVFACACVCVCVCARARAWCVCVCMHVSMLAHGMLRVTAVFWRRHTFMYNLLLQFDMAGWVKIAGWVRKVVYNLLLHFDIAGGVKKSRLQSSASLWHCWLNEDCWLSGNKIVYNLLLQFDFAGGWSWNHLQSSASLWRCWLSEIRVVYNLLLQIDVVSWVKKKKKLFIVC